MLDAKQRWTLLALAALAALVCFIDLQTPWGVTDWMLYVIPCVGAWWVGGPRWGMAMTLLCVSLVVLGFFNSPPGEVMMWFAIFNRVIGLIVILIGFWGVATITKRQQAELQSTRESSLLSEERLATSEQWLSMAQEAGRAATWDWNLITNAVAWSQDYYRLYGRPETELPSLENWLNSILPEDREPTNRRVQECIAQGNNTIDAEFRIRHPQLGVRHFQARGKLLSDASGQGMRMIGITFDVTDLKTTEIALTASEQALRQLNLELEARVAERTQALRENQEQLAAILRSATDAIINMDDQGRIQSANPATEAMFGYSQEELHQNNIRRLMPTLNLAEHNLQDARQLMAGNRKIIGTSKELIGRRKDGTQFPLELTISQVERRPLFTGIIRDITFRRELERQVLEIASLEQQRIGQDLHDGIGQEMTGLSMMAGALADKLVPAANGVKDLAARIASNIDRLQGQLRSISHGMMPVDIDPEGLRAALEDLCARLEEQARIECQLDCAECVLVDNNIIATHLYRIVQEATSNALRHGKAKTIWVSLSKQQDDLHLSIRDDGEGIHNQPDHPTGLGLHLMRGRASVLGGRLEVIRCEGGGTMVNCQIPWNSIHGINEVLQSGANTHLHRG